MKFLFVATAACMVAGSVSAHVVIADPRVTPGETQIRWIVVGEGCNGANTTALTMHVPGTMAYVVPIDMPGWVTGVIHDKMPNMRETITWTGGSLNAKHPGAFPVLLRPSERTGQIYLPVTQKCGNIIVEWNQTPSAGKPATSLDLPAPKLEVSSR